MTQTPHPVDETSFRASLARLRDAGLDPKHGLYGPGSVFREVNRHTVVYFMGAVQSVQMQLCHPWVATAVFEHSKIMRDPRQRARLTYIYLWSLIYGDLDMATRKAQALYKVHQRVTGELQEDGGDHHRGEQYSANEAHALLWVHVTAFWCRVRLYEQLVGPLSPAQRDRFVQEATLYALCFGIPESMHPADWAAVEAYVAGVAGSGTLARSEHGLAIRHFLERSIPRPLRGPLWNFLCVALPEPLQKMLDQPQATPVNRARADRTARRLAWLQRSLPATLRYVPAWHEAQARIAGRTSAGRTVELLSRLMLGQPRLVLRDT